VVFEALLRQSRAMLLIGMAKILISKDGDRLFPLARMYSSELFMANGRQKDGCGLATRRLSLSIKVCVYQMLCMGRRSKMGVRPSAGSPGGDYDLSNPVGSFTDVVRRVVARPVEFFSGIPRRGNYLAPLIFALICIEISTILGGLLRLAWGAETMGGVRYQGIAYGFGDFIADVILAPLGGAIGLFIFAAIAHLLVMLFVGEATRATRPHSGWSATSR
jgi:hypothetical protein